MTLFQEVMFPHCRLSQCSSVCSLHVQIFINSSQDSFLHTGFWSVLIHSPPSLLTPFFPVVCFPFPSTPFHVMHSDTALHSQTLWNQIRALGTCFSGDFFSTPALTLPPSLSLLLQCWTKKCYIALRGVGVWEGGGGQDGLDQGLNQGLCRSVEMFGPCGTNM